MPSFWLVGALLSSPPTGLPSSLRLGCCTGLFRQDPALPSAAYVLREPATGLCQCPDHGKCTVVGLSSHPTWLLCSTIPSFSGLRVLAVLPCSDSAPHLLLCVIPVPMLANTIAPDVPARGLSWRVTVDLNWIVPVDRRSASLEGFQQHDSACMAWL